MQLDLFYILNSVASSSRSLSTPPAPPVPYLSHLSDSCCVKVTVHLVEGPSLSSFTVVLWRCVNVRVFLIRLCTQTGPKAEAAPLCLKLTHSVSPFLFTLSISSVSSPAEVCSVFPRSTFSQLLIFLCFSTTNPCTHLKTMQTMCMTSCGRLCTPPRLPPWMAWAAWTCGTSTTTQRCVHVDVEAVLAALTLQCVCVCLASSGSVYGAKPEPHNQTTKSPATHTHTRQLQDSPVGVSHSSCFKSAWVTSPHSGSHPAIPLTFLQPLCNVQATSGPHHLSPSSSHTTSHQRTAQMC